LWYRKLASAPTVDDVEALREELLEKAPDMPDAAANLFERAWLKAFANEHNVKVISVVAGNLVVDPIDIPQDKMKPLRRAGARYNTDKRKLTLPLRYFTDEERDNLMPPIARFLEEMFGEKDEDESVPFAEVEGASSEAGLGADKNDGAGSPVPSLAGGVAGAAGTRAAAAWSAAQMAGSRSAAGPTGSGTASRSTQASGRPAARSERRARNQAKGEAARERLAAKRAARAAKRKEE
ncbi:MAG: TRCF domain-containing protein, partial [Adlercreutzia sp.]|nr:TRCF domain-containing protein [Adlercreutzia sp.]